MADHHHPEFPKGEDMIPQSRGYVTPEDPGHEHGDVGIRSIIIFLVVLVVVVGVFQVALGGLMSYYSEREKQLAVLRPDLFDDEVGQYAGPELQDSPNRDKPEIARSWAAQLDSYGWTDPSNKVARIPIDRAMSLLAQRGIEKVPENPLPYDVGQPEDPNKPEAGESGDKKSSQKPSDESKAGQKPAGEEPKVEQKKEDVEATPAPDPNKQKD